MTGQAVAAAHELQEERVRAVAWLALGSRATQAEPTARRRAAEAEPTARGRAALAALAARRRRVDQALAAYRAGAAGLGRTGDRALDQALAAATTRLGRLPVIRAETDRHLLTPDLAGGGHDALVDALLLVARSLAAHLDAPGPSRTARLLLAVAAAKEATGQERTLLAAVPAAPKTSSAARTAAARQTPGARQTPAAPTPGVRDPNPRIPGPRIGRVAQPGKERRRLSTARPPRPRRRQRRRTARCCGSGWWRGRRWPGGS